MSVYEVIARLPGIDEVRRTSRALAMLNAILSEPGEHRIYSFDAHWRPGQEAALMTSGSGDQYSIVFSSDGVIAQGFDHESPISHWNNPARKTWPGLFSTPADDRWHCDPVDAGVKDGADWMFELLAPGRPEEIAAIGYPQPSPDA